MSISQETRRMIVAAKQELAATKPSAMDRLVAAAAQKIMNAMTLEGFIRALFHGTKGEIRLRAFRSGAKQVTATVRGAEAVRHFAEKWKDTHDVYFSVATTDGTAQSTKENVVELVTAHLDLDLRGTDADATLERLKTFSPSIIVHSGGGFHAYWLFPEPLPPEERGRVEEMNKTLIRRLGADRGTHDVVRLLRLPETINHKPQYEKPMVKILFMDLSVVKRIRKCRNGKRSTN